MRLLLLVDDYLPKSTKIAAIMMHELALEFMNMGHEVAVCTPDCDIKSNFIKEKFAGVSVLRFKAGKIKGVSKIRRAINETLLSFFAWRVLQPYFRENRYDVVVYYSPTIFFGPLVGMLKRLWHCKSYLILRDIFPQWTVDNGLLSRYSPVYFYFKLFEYTNYSVADLIAVQSDSNKHYFRRNIRYHTRLDVLYNWSSINGLPETSRVYRDKLGLQNKVVFFYGGNIGHAQDMLNIARLAQSMSDSINAFFLLVGSGDEVELLNRYIEENQLKNIMCLPPVDQVEYQRMLFEFDVGLFSLHKDHKTHNFPGKLLGYMKYSLPILGSVNRGNDVLEVITKAEAGRVSINGDDGKFHENARLLLNSLEGRKKMGRNANELLGKTFSVKRAATQILVRFEHKSASEAGLNPETP